MRRMLIKVSALHAGLRVHLEDVCIVHALVQSRGGVQPPRGRCMWLWVDELIRVIRITETEHRR